MTIQELKEQIKANRLERIYIFVGEESLLKHKYVKEIPPKCLDASVSMMNLEIIDGKDASIDQIINAADTMPFMDQRRIVIVQESQLFTNSKSTEALKASSGEIDTLKEYISKIPHSSTLIFVENKVDKRNKLYQIAQKAGAIVEFSLVQGADLMKWIQQYLKSKKKKMSVSTIHYFITTVEVGLMQIQQELDKLCDFIGEQEEITENHIDSICSKSLQAKIFDLVDGIGEKNLTKAIETYNQLTFLKEPPVRILAMITRQFRMIYQIKKLQEEGCIAKDISKLLTISPYVVDKCVKQARNFGDLELTQAMKECLEVDVSIKTGKIDGSLGVEMLVIKYSQ